MCDAVTSELELACVESAFSTLPFNHIVLSVKPLSKHFKQWAKEQLAGRCNLVDPRAEVPSWSLPALGVQQLSYKQGKQLMASAARGGQLTTLQWARQQGCAWDCHVSEAAAVGGHLAVVQWLRQAGCPWGPSTCAAAAEGGHLEVLQWARKNNCGWSGRVCWAAAKNGHLQLLQWAIANGCPSTYRKPLFDPGDGRKIFLFAEGICQAAARGGHLEVLQWARGEGNSWGGQLGYRNGREMRGAAMFAL